MGAKNLKLMILSVLGGLLLVACSARAASPAGNQPPTAIPPVAADTSVVSEGRLVPRTSVELAFFTNGQVAEILVEEGDQVKAGDVVARLGNREAIESNIANAQVELLAAQQALKKLSDDLPEEQTAALQALNDAREAVRAAEQKLWGFDVPSEPIDIQVARSNVALAKKALDEAERNFKPYKNKPEQNFKRAALLNRLSDAQKQYDNTVKQLNRLTGEIVPEFDMEQAQTELDIAQARLKLAEEKQDLLKNGPDPDDLDAAKARISAAETSLAAARATLSNLELHATIDGTVVTQDLVVGQQVSAGQPVMSIADFSQMYAETDDLTEIEVVNITEGQKVRIVPDALPDVVLTGTVESISKTFEEKRGDITYTARILLDAVDPHLRWGMTVATTFED